MLVLGIETSCDETAASIVENGRKIRSGVVASSLEFHKKYGGVIPEIASRMHLKTIAFVVNSALYKAKAKLNEIDLIAVTERPGLVGSLLVGMSFAKSMGLGLNIPLIGINHLHAHIYSVFFNRKKEIKFPFIALVVSGGHTVLFLVKGFDNIKKIGSTLDDACGEAFDKVAKILGLGYPGGPEIERLARKGTPSLKLRCSDTKDNLDFSFSGIKTAVLYYVRGCSSNKPKNKLLSVQDKRDICASFQEAVVSALIRKSLLACKIKRVSRLAISGGVAMNNRLRQRFFKEAGYCDTNLYFPDKGLCMDNAVMVAGLGYQLFKKGQRSDLGVVPNSTI